jgi:hypothetical protein
VIQLEQLERRDMAAGDTTITISSASGVKGVIAAQDWSYGESRGRITGSINFGSTLFEIKGIRHHAI